MATAKEIAQGYAQQIRGSARTVQKSTVKTASVKQDARRVLDAVFKDIDEYKPDDRQKLLRALDTELGVTPGRMEQVKKGSVENLLNYEELVMQLMTDIDYD